MAYRVQIQHDPSLGWQMFPNTYVSWDEADTVGREYVENYTRQMQEDESNLNETLSKAGAELLRLTQNILSEKRRSVKYQVVKE